MKKLLALLCLALCAVLFTATAPAFAEEAERETFTSGDFEYALLDDGTAEITKYGGNADVLTLPDALDGHAVTAIGDYAFYECYKLTSATIPDSVTSIGDGAFCQCWYLTSVTIPDSVTSIGDWAFSFCHSLTSVTIPDSVTSIGANPFAHCSSLTLIAVSPDHPVLAVIDGVLFSKADKRLVCYPYAFTASSYSVPQGVESIGDSAFSGCYELTSVAIPDSVTFIGKAAFSGCVWLKSVTIPDSVTSIGDIAFLGCESLTLTVGRDSYAEEYCIENGLKYAGANG